MINISTGLGIVLVLFIVVLMLRYAWWQGFKSGMKQGRIDNV